MVEANPRRHGNPPYTVALVHGGPGWAGELAPVARELASSFGVLEPIQTATSVEGQLEELHAHLTQGTPPVVLVGFSWGAMLSILLTARYPGDVGKLVLLSSGALTEAQAALSLQTRLARLSDAERREAAALRELLSKPDVADAADVRAGLSSIMDKTETFAATDDDPYEGIPFQQEMARAMAADVQAVRRSGALVAACAGIRCPVVAIHGDYDPLPPDALRETLQAAVRDFRLVTLAKCGHIPWMERHARDRFYDVLRAELG